MNISMRILEEYLKKIYPNQVTSNIISGEMAISRTKLFTEPIQDDTVYVGTNKQFGIQKDKSCMVCKNQNDCIFVETDNLNDVFNNVLDCLHFYNEWERKCLGMAYKASTISKIVQAVNSVFDEYFIMLNYSLIILGYDNPLDRIDTAQFSSTQNLNKDYWSSVSDKQVLPLHLVNQISSIRTSSFVNKTDVLFFNSDILPILFTTLKTNDQIGLHLILTNISSPATEAKKQLFAKAKEFLSIWSLEGYNKKEFGDRQSLSHKMFCTREVTDTEIYESRLLQFGWKENAKKQFIQISNPKGNSVTIRQVSYNMNMINGCYCGYNRDFCYLLVNLDAIKESDFFNRIIRTIKTTSCRAGISTVFTDIKSVFLAQRRAEIALLCGNKEFGTVSFFNDYSLHGIKDAIAGQRKTPSFIYHPAVKVLENYDKEHEMDLSKTFLAYLLCGQNCTQTSKKLFLHRNTVEYRINKAMDLINVDFENEQDLAYLMISFFLRYEEDFKKMDQEQFETQRMKFFHETDKKIISDK